MAIPTIIGLVPVRNEARRIRFCLRALAGFTDAIVVLDDCSTDRTVEEVELLRDECRVQRILRNKSWRRDEPTDRNALLAAGRALGGTHFVVIDADEAFTSNCLTDDMLRNAIFRLRPGDTLALTWIQLWRDVQSYRFDQSIWTNLSKEVIFADDGHCFYESAFIHTPRIPPNLTGEKHLIPGYANGLLHFQHVDWQSLIVKQSWYRCLELIHNPRSSVNEINARYRIAESEAGLGLERSKPEWFSSYPFFEPSLFINPNPWQKEQVLEWFREYGREMFNNLDIWHVSWDDKASPDSLRSLETIPVRVLEKEMIDQVAKIPGWFTFEEILFLHRLASLVPDDGRLLEIGSYRGRSTNALGHAIKGSSRELYCVDIWRDFEAQGLFKGDPQAGSLKGGDRAVLMDFLKNSDWIGDQLRVLKCSTRQIQEFAPLYYFDLVFVDAAHDYENVHRDISLALRVLKPGGVICGHDFTQEGPDVVRAVRELVFGNKDFVEHGIFKKTTLWYARKNAAALAHPIEPATERESPISGNSVGPTSSSNPVTPQGNTPLGSETLNLFSYQQRRAIVASVFESLKAGSVISCQINYVQMLAPVELLKLYPHCLHLDEKNGAHYLVETKHTSWLCARVSPGDVVIDVGASYGVVSFALAKAVGSRGRVFAFEPARVAARWLMESIRLNSQDNISVVEAAASRNNGETMFREYSPHQALSWASDLSCIEIGQPEAAPSFRHYSIKTIRLDSFVEIHQVSPTVLKIDVEGFEEDVLLGALDILETSHPTLCIDIHDDPRTKVSTLDPVCRLLQRFGYRWEMLDHVLCAEPQPTPPKPIIPDSPVGHG